MVGASSPPVVQKNLSFHEFLNLQTDIYLHPDLYCDSFQAGDIVRVVQTLEEGRNSAEHPSLEIEAILRLPQPPKNVKSNTQISLSKRIAVANGFVARRLVSIEPFVDEKNIEADFLLLSFRDQYLGRADMYHVQLSLTDQLVFPGMKLSFGSIHITIQEITKSGDPLVTGIITNKTKIGFRSRSAKMFLCLQMSAEMWEFAEDSDLYFERAVNKFLVELFGRWKEMQTNHSVTIIFFSRVFYSQEEIDFMKQNGFHAEYSLPVLSEGKRKYRDYYKVIVDDEVRGDWLSVIKDLKREFMNYPSLIKWKPPLYGKRDITYNAMGQNSRAHQGNFLEAINLVLNEFSHHNVDRDLKHTGQSILVVSPGNGYYQVTRNLSSLTKQKIIDNGIACDLICVARPPLHCVPLFHFNYNDIHQQRKQGQLPKPSFPDFPTFAHLEGSLVYKFPFWIYISFFGACEKKNDILVAKLMECSLQGDSLPLSCPDHSSLKEPVLQLQGNYTSWMPVSESEEKEATRAASTGHRRKLSRNIPSSLASSRFSAHQSNFDVTQPYSSSRPFNTPTLTPTLIVLPNTFEHSSVESHMAPNLSYESPSNSLNSSFQESAPRVGSFSANIPDYSQPLFSATQMINPFHLGFLKTETSSSSRRWAHMYPKVADRKFTERNVSAPNLFTSDANWMSFSEPVCLPLGTPYRPTPLEFTKKYSVSSFYTLTSDDNLLVGKMEKILHELISQRLAQNYQLFLPHEGYFSGNEYVLALGHLFHRIVFEKSVKNIEVTRYHLKAKATPEATVNYQYALYPVNHKDFLPKTLTIEPTKEADYQWNSVDHLLHGDTSVDNYDSLRLWSIHFVLLPADKHRDPQIELDEEGCKEEERKQISAFLQFLEKLFQNRIFKGYDAPTISIKSEFNSEMTSSAQTSLSLNDVRMSRNHKSKPKKKRLFRRSSAALEKDIAISHSPGTNSNTPHFLSTSLETGNLVASNKSSNMNKMNSPDGKKTHHKCFEGEQKTMEIRLRDRTNVGRNQWLLLDYDDQFVPGCCYQMRIRWLVCTGSLIQEVYGHIERHAKTCDVVMIQVPAKESEGNIQFSFRAPVTIRLPSEVDKNSLLIRLGFVLYQKTEGNMEYMHRTGLAFVACCDVGFIWKYNHTPTLQPQMAQARELLKEIEEACSNVM